VFETDKEVLDWYERQPRALTKEFVDSIPWRDVRNYELNPDFVPVLVYMRDVEYFTEIYYRDYWFRQPWSKFAPTVACKLLDCGVDIGIKSVNVCLQRALRACGKPVAEDGVLGPLSVDAVAKTSPLMLLPALKSEIAAHYRLVAVAKPGEAQDLGGWLNRAYS